MRRLRTFAALLLFCLLTQVACHKKVEVAPVAAVAPVAPAPLPPARQPDIVLAPAKTPFKFVAYGDIRFTDSTRLRNAEVSDPFARDAIVKAIADAHPAFVLIGGDLVWRGADTEDWQRFDLETKPLYDAHIPLLPTVGNHDYLSNKFTAGGRAQGLRNFYRRFPNIPNRPATPWYSAQYANCYFLMLDSEDDDSQTGDQMTWVRGQLLSLPSSIDYVFLVLHRPPYTNATDKGHRPRPSEIEFAKMLESRQQVAPRPQIVVISGHVHNYERFEKHGVIYIVSGGGGAHPHPLRRRRGDLFQPLHPGEIEFHFCLVTVEGDRLKFEMYRLSDDRPARFELRDSFALPRPAK